MRTFTTYPKQAVSASTSGSSSSYNIGNLKFDLSVADRFPVSKPNQWDQLDASMQSAIHEFAYPVIVDVEDQIPVPGKYCYYVEEESWPQFFLSGGDPSELGITQCFRVEVMIGTKYSGRTTGVMGLMIHDDGQLECYLAPRGYYRLDVEEMLESYYETYRPSKRK